MVYYFAISEQIPLDLFYQIDSVDILSQVPKRYLLNLDISQHPAAIIPKQLEYSSVAL